ncbi:MAG: glycosyltransferase family 4 protein [Bacilli bacterium]
MNINDLRSFNVLRKFKIVSIVNALLIFKDSGFKGIKNKLTKMNNNDNISMKLQNPNFKIGYIDIIINYKNNVSNIISELKQSNLKFNIFKIQENKVSNKDYQTINKFTFENVFEKRAFIYVGEKECNFDFCFNINCMNKNLMVIINNILNKIENLKLLANYNQQNNITVKTSTFFDFTGTNYYSGGAERYLIDLFEVCKSQGINLNIYQNAERPFFRKYNDINVIGLNLKDMPINFNLTYLDKQSQNYIFQTFYNSQLHVYSAFQECYPNHIGPSIGISHGVSWDCKTNVACDGMSFWNEKMLFIEGAMLCDKLVSVDTNTANWFQTVDYELGNKKFSVIPNYVDTKEFCPRKDYLKKRDKIVITYPRRLYEPRGLYIVLNVIDKILKKYDNVEFHFVGKGFDEDVIHIENKIKEYPDRVFCYNKTPFEMEKVYKMSDISLIPTLYSEGTSLSCLEAMASGNVVISTRIGGLTDLIINNLNGYLIEPNENALFETLEKVIDNYDKQDRIKTLAVETAKAFNKDKWKKSWVDKINSFNLKGKSENNELIEVYVKNANNLNNKILNILKEELIKGNLVYLRSKTPLKNDTLSYGLLQVIEFDEVVESKAIRVYIEKGLVIKEKENVLEI